MPTMELDEAKARELEEKFDSEIRFRPLAPLAARLVGTLLVVLSLFHYYTAGFGLLPEMIHRGIHLSFVLGLIFLVFPIAKRGYERPVPPGLLHPLGISMPDWILAVAAVVAVLHVPLIPLDDLAFRVGNPTRSDVILGAVLVFVLLEATRRSVGWPLPIIALLFMAYAMLGQSMPGILVHPGSSFAQLIDHLYLTTQGIYGIALGVVATYVFHFVLFGVFATRIGLGQLFLDCAAWVAGRYAGGPAKVAIFGSALFGMISGSSVANTVTVGSLTIPAMIRLGYKKHFAAAVEVHRLDRRADHAADHGRGGVLDDRVPEPALHHHHHGGDRAGLHAFLRRFHAGAFRGQAQRAARAAAGGDARPEGGLPPRLADRHPARRADRKS